MIKAIEKRDIIKSFENLHERKEKYNMLNLRNELIAMKSKKDKSIDDVIDKLIVIVSHLEEWKK